LLVGLDKSGDHHEFSDLFIH
jgi:V-type H+-transporting ATPase subunit a